MVCDESSQEYMHRKYGRCVSRKVEMNTHTDDSSNQIRWFEWTPPPAPTKKNWLKTDRKYCDESCTKSQKQGSREVPADEICKENPRACCHIYNLRHQYRSLRQLKSQLSEDELMLHVDFSEHYTAKYADKFNQCTSEVLGISLVFISVWCT